MMKALLFVLSSGIFLSNLDAKDLRYQGAELDRIHKRSAFAPRKVKILLQDAKTNNKDAIRILEELHSYATLTPNLEWANEELDHVNATSTKFALIVVLRMGLWYDADGLHDILRAYGNSTEVMSKIKLLTAAYYTTFACIDLVRALAEVIELEPSQKANVSDTAKSLRNELNTQPVGSTIPDDVHTLAERVLLMAVSQSGEHQELS